MEALGECIIPARLGLDSSECGVEFCSGQKLRIRICTLASGRGIYNCIEFTCGMPSHARRTEQQARSDDSSYPTACMQHAAASQPFILSVRRLRMACATDR